MGEVESMRTNAPAAAPTSVAGGLLADEAVVQPLKGKERAAKGPLKLLDLPVDILKEIIHQVSPISCTGPVTGTFFLREC